MPYQLLLSPTLPPETSVVESASPPPIVLSRLAAVVVVARERGALLDPPRGYADDARGKVRQGRNRGMTEG